MLHKLRLFLLLSILFLFKTISAQIEESNIFIEALSKGDNKIAYGLFDTLISSKIPESQLGVIWSGLQTQAGKFIKSSSPRLEENIVYTPCEFEKATLDLKLVFNSKKKIIGFYFVPASPAATYQKPLYDLSNYTVKELFIKTKNYSLPAVLTTPNGKVNVPLVILIHGSGPEDKDESIGPNKIFKDLAAGLASKGIATLRYDKRTKVYSSSLKPDSVTIREEILDDAASAVNLVKTFVEINKSEIYLLGHSLGGMVAPQIAQENNDLKGIILLAANARPLQDLLLEQTRYVLSLDSLTDIEKTQIEMLEKQVKNSESSSLSLNTPSKELPMNIPARYWISLNKYHQLETAAKLKQRILILQGERDYQVTMVDFNLWKKNLSANKNVVFKLYPKLNHLFIEGNNKSAPKEYEQPGNVAPYVIDDISQWINGK
jgi:dienelactone hydrolase